MRWHPARVLTLCLSFCLLACSTAPPKEIPPRPNRAAILSFGLSGRAVISQNQKAQAMRLTWEHTPAQDAMAFASPLGSIVAELQRDAQGARWLTADGERYEARTADALLARLTDEPVPVDSLALWVLGRVSRAGQARLDGMGRLAEGTDSGWTIRVLAYEAERPDAMPSILEVEHGVLRIRLAIEEWEL